ncbi:nuclear transport factor 2 family protein [Marivita sp.]|uniref:nuclear transport factor 2 family protein n=1 Tax=Marivita sp. TaxID=2003365 RepID=UPI003A83BE3B
MPNIAAKWIAAGLLSLCLGLPTGAKANDAKELVIRALTEAMIERDVTAIDRYWAEDYIQHNPMAPSGREPIRGLIANAPKGATYEMGMVIAEGDLVAVHGRITGIGPKPLIAIDIYRVEDGMIAEHWDVIQEEVLETASGNPMFEPAQPMQ